ncbi:hypothetical protein J479_0114 [Acinetobacter baumannii 1297]|nr:hypothetical protein J479_0114 [Acinetobacter baumannii 1297]
MAAQLHNLQQYNSDEQANNVTEFFQHVQVKTSTNLHEQNHSGF